MGCCKSSEKQEPVAAVDTTGMMNIQLYTEGCRYRMLQDYRNAFRCFKTGHEKGDPACTYELSNLYRRGLFVEKDIEMADMLLQSSFDRMDCIDPFR